MNAPASHTATPADVLAGRARWCVVEGDCAEALRSLPIGCIDALVSDPPSGIAFMGAEWDRDKGGRLQWVAWLTGILSDARRATRDGGRALVWSLPRTSHWTGCAVEDAGWSIETTIAHLFGTGWPKGKAQTKPAQETWWLARTGKSEALNVEACRVGCESTRRANSSRTGGRERDCNLIDRGDGRTPDGRDLAKILARIEANRGMETGSTVGRYPPNLVLSHAEGCVCEGTRQAPRNIGRDNFNPSKRARNAYGIGVGQSTDTIAESVEAWACVEGCPVAELDRQAGVLGRAGNLGGTTRVHRGFDSKGAVQVSEMPAAYDDATTSASRFFPQFPADDPDAPWSEALFRYVAKPSRAERNAGCDGLPRAERASVAPVASGKVMRCAECRRTHPMTYRGPCHRCGSNSVFIDDAADDGSGRDGSRVHANTHPTVKSVALMRWLLRLVTKPGDVVLDPFGGSGTTGVAALLEGRRVVLIEREPQYAAIARARCAAAEGTLPAQLDLLAATGT
jgi:site-specific DNA-methyltransferase (adenine-specific)